MKAIEIFEKNINRSLDLLEVHKQAYRRGRPVSGGESDDLLRSSMVFGMAALDSYFRKRTMEVVLNIITKEKRIPEPCVELITKTIKKDNALRTLINIALQDRPHKIIMRLFERSLAKKTFQKPDDINEAFEMMNLVDGWKDINKAVNIKPGPKRKGRKPDTKKIILDIAQRRDAIVHEGDLYLSDKHHGKVKIITRTEVENGLRMLKRIIEAAEKISNEKIDDK
jgi:hypothetical protein